MCGTMALHTNIACGSAPQIKSAVARVTLPHSRDSSMGHKSKPFFGVMPVVPLEERGIGPAVTWLKRIFWLLLVVAIADGLGAVLWWVWMLRGRM
jgi:hypothetical protein